MRVREKHNPTDVQKLYVGGAELKGYPVGSSTANLKVVAAATAVTGSVVVDLSSHLSSIVSATANLTTAPGAAAGDPFLVRAAWSGTTATFTVYQDAATAAANAGSIAYIVVGAGV